MRVSEIHFNHDPTSAEFDAINLRDNGDPGSEITTPEWVDGKTPRSVAYLAGTLRNPVTIKVKFTDGPPNADVPVRAVKLYPAFGGLFTTLGPKLGAFAAVRKRPVAFDVNGESLPTEFEVTPGWGAGKDGVGITNIILEWQVRGVNGPWTTFQRTEHRLLQILALPGPPWTQQIPEPIGEQLPWAAALEKACLWASWSQTIESAAEAIANQLNSNPIQSYQTAPVHIVDSELQLANYLASFDGTEAFAANCRDMAAVLAAFVNILGGNLRLLKITNSNPHETFKTRLILPLTASDWIQEVFYRHFVVLDPATVPNGAVNGTGLTPAESDAALMYDACLKVNDTVKELPIRMPVGNVGASGYRHELIETGDGLVAMPSAALPIE